MKKLFIILLGLGLNTYALDHSKLEFKIEDMLRFDSVVAVLSLEKLENENYSVDIEIDAGYSDRTINCEIKWDGDQKVEIIKCDRGLDWFKTKVSK